MDENTRLCTRLVEISIASKPRMDCHSSNTVAAAPAGARLNPASIAAAAVNRWGHGR